LENEETVMVVCAHGNVTEFCENHEMLVFEKHEGPLDEYKGSCPVVVTDQKMTREEYDRLKCVLFGAGIELVSVDWTDDEVILRLLRSQVDSRKNRSGRQMFGFYRKNGVLMENPALIVVARKVIELRDAGYTLRDIRGNPDIAWADGRRLAMSTIQAIIKNRDKYV
jgi:hypothetical protein